jgi:hypothetical protein
MKKPTIDVKILATPGAALDETAKRVWATAERSHCPIAVEQIHDPRQIALFGAPATPALIIGGQLVSTGVVPEANAIKSWLHH